MQEHRYRARDKTVKKMTREGLTEENLRSHKSVRISSKELDSLQLSGQPEDQIDTQKLCMDEAKATKRRLVPGRNLAGRDTAEETEVISGRSMEQSPLRIDKGSKDKEEPDKDKTHGHKYRSVKEYKKEFHTIPDGMADDSQDKRKRFIKEQGEQADEDIEEETSISARLNEHSIRADSIQGVLSGKQEYVKAAAEISHNRKKKQVQAHAKQLKESNKDTTAKKYKKEFSTVPYSMADDGKDKWKRFTEEQGEHADEDVPEETGASARINEHSLRTESIRRTSYEKHEHMKDAEELSHKRKKKQVQAYANQQKKKTDEYQKQDTIAKNENRRFRDNQESADNSLEVFSDEIKGKAKREQIHKEQRKSVSRLSFEDEGGGMVRGSDMGIVKKTTSMATGAVSVYLHGKGHEAEQDNTAIEASHRAELAAEDALRYAMARSGRRMHQKPPRLLESSGGTVWKGRTHLETVQQSGKIAGKYAAEFEQGKKREIQRFWQKQRYKKMYQAARNGEQASQTAIQVSQTIIVKAKKAAAAVIRRSSGFLGATAAMVMLFALAATSLSSCSAFLQGGTTTVVGTTYPSTDEDIYAVENAYKALENALNEQINSMESRHPDYDDYRYQVDEISHNPYHLISYFTAKYGEFTYRQVADEVEEIFRQQYGISTENTRATVTETRTVRVGESLGQVVTSGYCSCPICCGVWSGGPTASGVYPTANHTIAVDASNPFVPMGTRVVMNGVEYVVEDTGGFAQYGVQFDVYYGDHAAASAHGHQTWEAYIADSNGSQEVEVTSTHEVNRLDVSLTNHNLDAVLRSRMDENEEKRYDIYNTTLGNRDYLFDNLPSYGSGGFGYDIPAEALSDRKFANMIREAEKYLGYPYVWGGASPSTSFDCSGFVSWVINNCGNGWNVGRQTADGLRGCCSYVSPSEAKPGDLIFFQGTYSTPGASHVGIYVGNNMMIHCGNPIQYTSISSSYWQEHFMAFGRIH